MRLNGAAPELESSFVKRKDLKNKTITICCSLIFEEKTNNGSLFVSETVRGRPRLRERSNSCFEGRTALHPEENFHKMGQFFSQQKQSGGMNYEMNQSIVMLMLVIKVTKPSSLKILYNIPDQCNVSYKFKNLLVKVKSI